MRRYGQFCPVAKSAEILGDPWTILIVRELLLGSTRFSELQRGLPKISPTVLSARLRELEDGGVIVKRGMQGQRGHAYRLTSAGRELSHVIESLVVWGMRWAREKMNEEDTDVSLLMLDIQRNVRRNALPDGETVLCFKFSDTDAFATWWLVCDGTGVDLCYDDPGKDVSAYLVTDSRTLIGVRMGDIALSAALADERITLIGEPHICRHFRQWFPLSPAAKVQRPADADR